MVSCAASISILLWKENVESFLRRTVGLSRQHTADKPPTPPPKDNFLDTSGLAPPNTITNDPPNGYMNGHVTGTQSLNTMRTFTNGQLFTADELANAMSQSTLTPSRKERS